MINLGTRGNKFGFYVRVRYHIRFISMGNVDTMTEQKMRRLLTKARKLEMQLMNVEEKAPMTISDLLRGNKVKYVQASGGKVRLALPNCNAKSITIRPAHIDPDAHYLATRVMNHCKFPMSGMTFPVIKSLIKQQMYSAL